MRLEATTMRENKIRPMVYVIMLYCALVPLENILASSLGGSVNRYIGIAIMVLVAVWILVNRHFSLQFNSVLLPTCFALFALASVLWTNVDAGESLQVMLSSLFLTVIAVQYPLSNKEFRFVLHGMVIGGVIFSLILISGGAMTDINDVSGGRMSLTIGDLKADNNNLALSLCIPTLCALFFVFDKTLKKAWRITQTVFLFLMLLAVLMTGSRGALLALIAAVAIFFIRRAKKFNLKPLFFFALIALIAVFLATQILPEELLARFSLSDVKESGGTGRLDIWKNAWNYFVNSSPLRWLFGNGFGSFANIMKNAFGTFKAAHNDTVQVLLELGIVGLLIFACMWTKFFRQAFKKKSPLLLALMVLMLIGSFSMELLIKKMLWLCVYLVLVYPPQTQEQPKESPKIDRNEGR